MRLALVTGLLLSALLASAARSQPATSGDPAPPGPRTVPAAGHEPPHPTLAEIFHPPTLLGLRPTSVSVSADGRFAVWRWTPDERPDPEPEALEAFEAIEDGRALADHLDPEPRRDWWIAPTDGSAAPAVLFPHDASVDLRWLKEGATLLVEREEWLDLLDADTIAFPDGGAGPADAGGHAGPGRRATGVSRPLFAAPGPRRIALTDDARHLVASCGAERQLWVVDLATGARHAASAGLVDLSDWFDVCERAGIVAVFAREEEEAGAQADAADPARTDDAPGGGGAGSGPRGEGADTVPGEPAHRAGGDRANGGAGGPARRRSGTDGGTPGEETDDDDPRRLWLLSLDGGTAPRGVDVEEGGSVDVSPDGRWLVRRRSEYLTEHRLVMADYLTTHVSTVPVRNSLAGDPAPAMEFELADLETGEPFTIPLDASPRYYLRRLAWSPDGAALLVDRTSEDFHVRQIVVVDPVGRRGALVVSERDDAWIGGPRLVSGWTDGGHEVLFTSERSGFNHLYAVGLEGEAPRALTAGGWEVQQLRVLRDTGRVLVLGNTEEDPAVRRALIVDTTSGERRAVGPAGGWVTAAWASRDASRAVMLHERLGVPGDLFAASLDAVATDAGRAREAGSGRGRRAGDDPPALVRLTDTVPEALEALELPAPEIVSYENPDDGRTVRAYLYRPEPFDPGRAYPAVVFVHGAGYLQQVRRSTSAYAVNMLFHHRLARQGFVVLDPDYRHSAGYGRDFRAEVHGWMGGKDLDDVVAGVAHLGSLGFVDIERVGLYGGSYGGFMTLMALFTKPEVFACGAALRSVTDWRVYNHWYTNPRLGDPEEDADAYARSSPIDHVDGLEDPLLLLHGLKDDNVFAQDTIRLVEALIERGKDFELMLYPSQRHGFDDPESWIDEYTRIERLFREVLRPEDG